MSQIKFNVRQIRSTTGNNASFTTVWLYLNEDIEVSRGERPGAACIYCDEKSHMRGGIRAWQKRALWIVVRQRQLMLRS
jgi:hypothetical protein